MNFILLLWEKNILFLPQTAFYPFGLHKPITQMLSWVTVKVFNLTEQRFCSSEAVHKGYVLYISWIICFIYKLSWIQKAQNILKVLCRHTAKILEAHTHLSGLDIKMVRGVNNSHCLEHHWHSPVYTKLMCDKKQQNNEDLEITEFQFMGGLAILLLVSLCKTSSFFLLKERFLIIRNDRYFFHLSSKKVFWHNKWCFIYIYEYFCMCIKAVTQS